MCQHHQTSKEFFSGIVMFKTTGSDRLPKCRRILRFFRINFASDLSSQIWLIPLVVGDHQSRYTTKLRG
jgi:hypothetical protein